MQEGYDYPEIRRRYRDFYARPPELFAGLESLAYVGVAFFFSQTHYENASHLSHLHHTRKALADGHLLFDYLTEEDVTRERLARYRVVILPQVSYIADPAVRALQDWVKAGGARIVTGSLGDHDEIARKKPAPAFAELFAGQAAETRRGVHVVSAGKGKAAWVSRIQSVAPLSDAEQKLLHLSGETLREAMGHIESGNRAPEAPLVSLVAALARTDSVGSVKGVATEMFVPEITYSEPIASRTCASAGMRPP